MLAYWIPLAGMFLGMVAESQEIGRVCLFVVIGWAGLVPLAGVIRVAIALLRAASTGRMPAN